MKRVRPQSRPDKKLLNRPQQALLQLPGRVSLLSLTTENSPHDLFLVFDQAATLKIFIQQLS